MSYIGRQPVPQAARYLQEGTLTTPSDEIVVTGGYSVHNIHVFINGVLLPTTEYTANDGLKIVFDSPLPEGTKYLVEEFRTFEVAELGTAAMHDVATEAEAIAGTPDVLPTAERVIQAIVAWFNGISGALGRTILSRTTAAQVRGDLELGTAATKDVGTASGNVMQVGTGGLLNVQGFNVPNTTDSDSYLEVSGSRINLTAGTDPSVNFGAGLFIDSLANKRWLILGAIEPKVFYKLYREGLHSAPVTVEMYSTGNTTVDSNGFIKQASPIIKLHIDLIEKSGDFVADFERIDTGHYLIKNTLGLAQEGWYIETPKDANGNVKVFVEYTDNDGDITIKTYEPDYSTGRVTAGVPADIPEGRWIDIRLHELPPEPETDETQTD